MEQIVISAYCMPPMQLLLVAFLILCVVVLFSLSEHQRSSKQPPTLEERVAQLQYTKMGHQI